MAIKLIALRIGEETERPKFSHIAGRNVQAFRYFRKQFSRDSKGSIQSH